MKIFVKWQLLFLTILVIASQFFLLRVILGNGFTGDDLLLLFDYKASSEGVNFLDKLYGIFRFKGIYTTYQVIYIGILESIFKGNYQAYQITNIIFKTLATLSLYPLILILFKRRSLAFLTTILFAISYSSTGALQFVVKGSDYLAIFFMNICLITYYYSLVSNKRFTLFTTTLFLFLSFVFSPIRVYPFLIFIILVEIITRRKPHQWMSLLFRLIIIFSPFIIILLLGPKSTVSYLSSPVVVFKFIFYGNYQLLLTPFAGLGYTFLPGDYLSLFGKVNYNNFKDYFTFLLHGPVIIYSILAILLGFLLTKKPFMYILGTIFTNVIFQVLTYFLVTNMKEAVGPNVKGFYQVSTNAIFLGFFVISVSVSSLIIWLRNRKLNLLYLSIFAGPIFSNIFLWGTWLIIGDNLTFKEGIHWYLIIPPIGTSLFLASLMVMGFDKIKVITYPYLKYTFITCLLILLVPVYLISSKEINTTFGYLLSIGYGAYDQEKMNGKLLSFVNMPLDKKPALFFLDASEDLDTPQMYYPTVFALVAGFNEKMHFRNWELMNGCTALVTDKTFLNKSIFVKGDIKGFNVESLCVNDYTIVDRPKIFYTPDNLYAFKLKDKEVIDIKKEILDELEF